MILPRRGLLASLAASGLAAPSARAVQSGGTRRPITLLVGAAEGTDNDKAARIFAEALGPRLGLPQLGGVRIDVQNMPGEGGLTMLRALESATPGGATIGWVLAPTIPARIIDRGEVALLQRIELVGQVEREPIAFVSPEGDPANTLQDIIQRAGNDDDAAPLATPPAGSPAHLAAMRLQVLAQTRLNIIAFPSTAAARQAVLAGNVPAAALGVSSIIGDVRDGTLTAIGIASKRRFGLLPDAPILDEAGFPLSAIISRGIAVPAGTPGDLIATLAEAMRAVTADEDFRQLAETGGYRTVWADGPAWLKQMQTEQEVLAKLWETDPWLSSSGG